MHFGITRNKQVIGTLYVSDQAVVTNKKGEPVGYRTRTSEEMFQHARHIAQGCGVYPLPNG